MNTYVVSYDMRDSKNANYDALTALLKSYPKSFHILESTWVIASNDSADNIAELIHRINGHPDVFISRLEGRPSYLLKPESVLGLREYLVDAGLIAQKS